MQMQRLHSLHLCIHGQTVVLLEIQQLHVQQVLFKELLQMVQDALQQIQLQ